MRNDGTETMNTDREAVNPITQGVIWKQLLLYFAPLLGASFLQLLYNTADTIIVGRFVGKTALTAVGGSAGQIYAMVTEFMIGMSGGAGVILSQAYGAKNRKLLDGHNLTWLCKQAAMMDNSFAKWLEKSTALNRYYIETRYPADILLEIDKGEIDDILDAASEMLDFICEQIKFDFNSYHKRGGKKSR